MQVLCSHREEMKLPCSGSVGYVKNISDLTFLAGSEDNTLGKINTAFIHLEKTSPNFRWAAMKLIIIRDGRVEVVSKETETPFPSIQLTIQ